MSESVNQWLARLNGSIEAAREALAQVAEVLQTKIPSPVTEADAETLRKWRRVGVGGTGEAPHPRLAADAIAGQLVNSAAGLRPAAEQLCGQLDATLDRFDGELQQREAAAAEERSRREKEDAARLRREFEDRYSQRFIDEFLRQPPPESLQDRVRRLEKQFADQSAASRR